VTERSLKPNEQSRSLRNDLDQDNSFIKNLSPINSFDTFIHIQNKETVVKPMTLQLTPSGFVGQIGLKKGVSPGQKMLGATYEVKEDQTARTI